MIGSSLSIVDRKYLFTIVIMQTHFSEVAVDTDLARRKSGDFFSCKGLVKKYRGVGRSREGVGHEVLSLVQGVGRAILCYP